MIMIKRKSLPMGAIVFTKMNSYFSATFCKLVDFARNFKHPTVNITTSCNTKHIFADGTLWPKKLENELPTKGSKRILQWTCSLIFRVDHERRALKGKQMFSIQVAKVKQ